MSIVATVGSPTALAWIGFAIFAVVAVAFSLVLRRVMRLKGTHRLKRWVPVVHVVVWALVVGVAVVGVAAHGFTTALLVVLLLLTGIGLAGMDWFRNVVAGLLLFGEGGVQRGERIRVGDHHGEVVAIGVRSVRLENGQGVIHEVPHVELVGRTVSRFDEGADAVCEMVVELAATEAPEALLEEVRLMASAAVWAAPSRRPEVFWEEAPEGEGKAALRIRAYAISAKHCDAYRGDLKRDIATLKSKTREAQT